MSALEIQRRNDHNGRGIDLHCEGGCTNTHRGPDHHNSAIRIAYICGRPAAGLCAKCAKDWERMWGRAAA
jgi:hypothetical protein